MSKSKNLVGNSPLYAIVSQNKGEPPKKKLSPASSSIKEMKTIEPEDDSSSSSSSSSGSPVRMIDEVEWKTNQSFFRNEDEESVYLGKEEVKSLTEEEIEEVDIFLGELEYFQNFFNLNEYDKRAGEYLIYLGLFHSSDNFIFQTV